ncbi:hypothetical protein [Litchfieldia alkalitelluris]|uniref:hypothetical protein n=1 Tax=Litchfieldia alkalitelluris TaxID=304268 RepID=UPI000998919D|nr:hypothetical protein [Litchfieldia alkalitelluris]
MKPFFFTCIFTLMVVFFSQPPATEAAYDASSDQTVSVTLLSNYIKPPGTVGTFSFSTQEEVHHSFKSVSGQEVDHYYIWIELNGVKVLAIDPIKPVYN